MNKLTISLASAALTLAIAQPARAASFGEWLAFCAGGSTQIDAKIQKDSMTTCGVEAGVKSACTVLSGTPWACSTPTAKTQESEPCDEQVLNFTIGGGFEMPAGWKVEGTATAKYKRVATKTNINVCQAAPIIPTPIAMGGDYSAESGDISFLVKFDVDANITVVTPVPGVSAKVNTGAGCGRTTQGHYFKKAETNSCGSPTPPPTAPPTASPTASPSSPSPTPGGSPSPTPGHTPSPTPSTPSPTPGHTPSPTPSTPSPTPGQTPTPTASATPNPTPFQTPPATPIHTGA